MEKRGIGWQMVGSPVHKKMVVDFANIWYLLCDRELLEYMVFQRSHT